MARPQIGSLPPTPEAITSGDAGSPGASGQNAALSGHRHPATGIVSLGHLEAHRKDASAHPDSHSQAHDHSLAADGSTLDPEHLKVPTLTPDLGLPPALSAEVVAIYSLFGEITGLAIGKFDSDWLVLTPVSVHEAAGDPHPGYALETAVNPAARLFLWGNCS